MEVWGRVFEGGGIEGAQAMLGCRRFQRLSKAEPGLPCSWSYLRQECWERQSTTGPESLTHWLGRPRRQGPDHSEPRPKQLCFSKCSQHAALRDEGRPFPRKRRLASACCKSGDSPSFTAPLLYCSPQLVQASTTGPCVTRTGTGENMKPWLLLLP